MKLNRFAALLAVILSVSMHVNAAEANNDVTVSENTPQQTSTNPEAVPANQPPETKTTTIRKTRTDNGYNEVNIYPVPVVRPVQRAHRLQRVNSAPKVSPAQTNTIKN